MSLKDYSANDLIEELKRREKVKESIPQPKLPHEWNFGVVVAACKDYIHNLSRDYDDQKWRDPDDYRYLIFEAAIEAVYGKEVWQWVKKQSSQ